MTSSRSVEEEGAPAHRVWPTAYADAARGLCVTNANSATITSVTGACVCLKRQSSV